MAEDTAEFIIGDRPIYLPSIPSPLSRINSDTDVDGTDADISDSDASMLNNLDKEEYEEVSGSLLSRGCADGWGDAVTAGEMPSGWGDAEFGGSGGGVQSS